MSLPSPGGTGHQMPFKAEQSPAEGGRSSIEENVPHTNFYASSCLSLLKPPYTYAQLTVQAIKKAPAKKLTAIGIFKYLTRKYAYFRICGGGWRNSIRYILHKDKCFVKVPRLKKSRGSGGKSCFWTLCSSSAWTDPIVKRMRGSPRELASARGCIPSMSTPSTCPTSSVGSEPVVKRGRGRPRGSKSKRGQRSQTYGCPPLTEWSEPVVKRARGRRRGRPRGSTSLRGQRSASSISNPYEFPSSPDCVKDESNDFMMSNEQNDIIILTDSSESENDDEASPEVTVSAQDLKIPQMSKIPKIPNLPENSDDEYKPPYSYEQLIVQVLSIAPNQTLDLAGIVSYIKTAYPFYRRREKELKGGVSVRLSQHAYFVKVPRSKEEPGRGSFWTMDPVTEERLIKQAWTRKILKKKGQDPPSCATQHVISSCSTSPDGDQSSVTHDCVKEESNDSVMSNEQNDIIILTDSSESENDDEASPQVTVSTTVCCQDSAEDLKIPQMSKIPSVSDADDEYKPPYDCPELIVQALSLAPYKTLDVAAIISSIKNMYPFYRSCGKQLKNNVAVKLSQKGYFVKMVRPKGKPGKGCLWTMDPMSEEQLIKEAWMRKMKQSLSSCPVTEEDTDNQIPIVPDHPVPQSDSGKKGNEDHKELEQNTSFTSPNDQSVPQIVGRTTDFKIPQMSTTPNFAESLPTIVDSVSRADSQENANDECRPPYTWQQLILQAIDVAPDRKLDLAGIKTYIETTYSFYRRTGLKLNALLSDRLNKMEYFVKVPRPIERPGLGSLWTIDEDKLIKQAWMKMKRKQVRTCKIQQGSPDVTQTPSKFAP